MHRVQTPCNEILKIWRDLSNEKIECPIRRSRQRHPFRPYVERHNLHTPKPIKTSPDAHRSNDAPQVGTARGWDPNYNQMLH